MKPFPWGLLTLVLLALDLLLYGLWRLRKRLARRMLRRLIAQGKREEAERFIIQAQADKLIKAAEAEAWRQMFG
jgi:hypothetical protein